MDIINSIITDKPVYNDDRTYALVPIFTDTQKTRKIRLSIICKIDMINNYSYSFNIPRTSVSYDKLLDLDKACLDIVESKNGEWFKNSMTAKQIEDYFRPSITMQDSFVIPIEYDATEDLSLDVGNMVQIEIMLKGIIIHQQSFGLKWKLTDINLINTYNPDEDESDNATTLYPEIDKKEIEDEWDVKVDKIYKKLANKIVLLDKKKAKLEEHRHKITETLKFAKAENTPNAIWDEKLIELQNLIYEFESGFISINQK